MPTYEITDNETGRVLEVTGDSPPTDQEIGQIFDKMKDAPSGMESLPSPISRAISGVASPITGIPTAMQEAQRGFALQPQQAPGIAATVGHVAGEIGPSVAGGILGTPGGIPGQMAGVGGARALQNLAAQAYPNAPTMGQAALDVGVSAGLQGALGGAGSVLSRIAPGLRRAGAQAWRALGGVPEKYGEAFLKNPAIGKTPEEVSAAYSSFERGMELTSPRLSSAMSGDIVQGAGAALDSVQSAAKGIAPYIDEGATRTSGRIVYNIEKIKTDDAIGLFPHELKQALYNASQSASHLLNMAKAGSPTEIANTANIQAAKSSFDDILEAFSGNYRQARTAAFENKVRESVSSFFPLNRNQSVNQLRGWSGIQAALLSPFAAAAVGPVGLAGLAVPFVQSPAVMAGAIRAGSAAAPAVSAATRAIPGYAGGALSRMANR